MAAGWAPLEDFVAEVLTKFCRKVGIELPPLVLPMGGDAWVPGGGP
jgi:hypothetical protein